MISESLADLVKRYQTTKFDIPDNLKADNRFKLHITETVEYRENLQKTIVNSLSIVKFGPVIVEIKKELVNIEYLGSIVLGLKDALYDCEMIEEGTKLKIKSNVETQYGF